MAASDAAGRRGVRGGSGVRAYVKALGLAYAAVDLGIEKDTGRLVC
jgi:hypothetical protein